MKRTFKNFGLRLFIVSQLPKLFRYLNRNKALVLMYHGFTENGEKNGFENIENIHLDIQKFEQQVKYLTTHYNVIPLEKLVECIEQKKPFPKKSVVITIDDGYESNYKLAFEVLKKYNCPAIIFLTTDFVNDNKILWTDLLTVLVKKLRNGEFVFNDNGNSFNETIVSDADKIFLYKKLKSILKNVDQSQRDALMNNIIEKYALKIEASDYSEKNFPLNWQQIREMIQSKLVTVGAHTCKHYILGKLSADLARKEIADSKRIIEENTGQKCDIFCYPNGQPGDYNQVTKKILAENGFRCSLTTVQNFVTTASDIFELERIYVSNRDNLLQFIISLSGFRFKNMLNYTLNLFKI